MSQIRRLHRDAIVLDPMAGSGTVLWHAATAGHRAIGFDLDPLAVLISKVRTSPIGRGSLGELAVRIVSEARSVKPKDAHLPWIDGDLETKQFVKYWFGASQAAQLRVLVDTLWKKSEDRLSRAHMNALKLVISRLIITKQRGASLAWDISHSRPHRVIKENEFDVFFEFVRSATKLERELNEYLPLAKVKVYQGDARSMYQIADRSVDAVITSPPYLNAIDYLRGHKLSLVWLGHRVSDLRRIRSESIGAERGVNGDHNGSEPIVKAFGDVSQLPKRHQRMIVRYAVDIRAFIAEIVRVLKPRGKAVLVVGNSCLKDVFIRNSDAVVIGARLAGLRLTNKRVRDLPENSRYLPIRVAQSNSLRRRMRTEVVMTFVKP